MNDPRQDKFVPLCPTTNNSKERTDFRVTVLRDAQITQSFQPLGRAAPPTVPAASTAPVHIHDPQVTLQHEGDRVTGIQIQCTCGRVIELGCVYQTSTGAASL